MPRRRDERVVEVDFAEGARLRDEEVLEAWRSTGEMDAADLLDLDLPPLQMVVEGLLPEGTTLLAAEPKIGKSVMAYQLSVAVALGGVFLGRQCAAGQVLYMSLEDGKRRGQERLRAALHAVGRSNMPRSRLTVRWESPVLGMGLEENLAAWLDDHPPLDAVGGGAGGVTLIIIDTLAKIRGVGDGRRNAYEVDVQELGVIQGLLKDRPRTALLVIHHTKKGREDDFVAKVSGTYGITGSADTTMVLERKRLSSLAKLEVTSRDLPEESVALTFEDRHWDLAPAGLGVGISAERLAVYEVVASRGPIFAAAIARELRIADRTAVQHLLRSLLVDGAVMRIAGGYVVTDEGIKIVGEGGSEESEDSEMSDSRGERGYVN